MAPKLPLTYPIMNTKLGVYRSNQRGSWVIDRRFRGVGEIRRSTGTSVLTTAQAISGMLTSLYQVGRLDILKRIQSRDLSLLEAYALHIQGDLLTAGRRDTLQLADTWPSWVSSYRCSEDYRKQLKWLLSRLLEGYTLRYEDLPDRLRSFRGETKDKPALFNRVKSALQSYVHHTKGTLNPVYIAISDIPRMRECPTPIKALSLTELSTLFGALKARNKAVLEDCRTMALTGMGPKEYIKDGWTLASGGIAIHGKKRDARERLVPLVAPPTPAQRKYNAIYRNLSSLGCAPYQLRHTYKRLLEDSGLPLTRIASYMGHSAASMTEHYGRYSVVPHLVEDALAVKAHLKGYPDILPDTFTEQARSQC